MSKKVSVSYTTTHNFIASVGPHGGALTEAKEGIAQMFEALERYQIENGIELGAITLHTQWESEDHEPMSVKYRITASYSKDATPTEETIDAKVSKKARSD
jgi:hypothetical protein